jgi:hypothetical protein
VRRARRDGAGKGLPTIASILPQHAAQCLKVVDTFRAVGILLTPAKPRVPAPGLTPSTEGGASWIWD